MILEPWGDSRSGIGGCHKQRPDVQGPDLQHVVEGGGTLDPLCHFSALIQSPSPPWPLIHPMFTLLSIPHTVHTCIHSMMIIRSVEISSYIRGTETDRFPTRNDRRRLACITWGGVSRRS